VTRNITIDYDLKKVSAATQRLGLAQFWRALFREASPVSFFSVFQRRRHQLVLLRDAAGDARDEGRRQVRVRPGGDLLKLFCPYFS
jgi:hypothetical protein